MTALATRIFAKASVEAIAEIETLVSLALFCFGGLLVSVSITGSQGDLSAEDTLIMQTNDVYPIPFN